VPAVPAFLHAASEQGLVQAIPQPQIPQPRRHTFRDGMHLDSLSEFQITASRYPQLVYALPVSERFGHNLRTLREQRDMQQSDLAGRMRDLGHSWHQSTVAKAENGTRAVSYEEAAALAEILRTSLDRFRWHSAEATGTEMVYAAGARLRQRYEQVAESVAALLTGERAAGRILAEHDSSEWERVREAVEDVRHRLGEYRLEHAIAEGERRAADPDGAG